MMTGRRMDGMIRRVVPSLAPLTRKWWFSIPLDVVGWVGSVCFKEFRSLPPNRLRVRVGVGNRLLFNQGDYVLYGTRFWLSALGYRLVSLNSDVFEVGCGCGRSAYTLRQCGAFSGRYTGVDADAEMVEWCREHYGGNRFVFEHADVFNSVYNPRGSTRYYVFPVDNGSQDFVFSQSVFSHLLEDRVENYLREAFRVLRPGGCAMMSFFCLDALQVQRALGGRWLFSDRIGNAYVEKKGCPEAAIAYRGDFLVKMSRDIGFSSAVVGETALFQNPLICFKGECDTRKALGMF